MKTSSWRRLAPLSVIVTGTLITALFASGQIDRDLHSSSTSEGPTVGLNRVAEFALPPHLTDQRSFLRVAMVGSRMALLLPGVYPDSVFVLDATGGEPVRAMSVTTSAQVRGAVGIKSLPPDEVVLRMVPAGLLVVNARTGVITRQIATRLRSMDAVVGDSVVLSAHQIKDADYFGYWWYRESLESGQLVPVGPRETVTPTDVVLYRLQDAGRYGVCGGHRELARLWCWDRGTTELVQRAVWPSDLETAPLSLRDMQFNAETMWFIASEGEHEDHTEDEVGPPAPPQDESAEPHFDLYDRRHHRVFGYRMDGSAGAYVDLEIRFVDLIDGGHLVTLEATEGGTRLVVDRLEMVEHNPVRPPTRTSDGGKP